MKRRTIGPSRGRYWPTFDSPFLADVVASLRRRSKTIKHNAGVYSCERVVERVDRTSYEKLELYFEKHGGKPLRLSCSIWPDRWTWVDVRKAAQRGWAFEWRHEGRIGATSPADVAATIVDRLMHLWDGDLDYTAAWLDELWRTVAITGPRGAA